MVGQELFQVRAHNNTTTLRKSRVHGSTGSAMLPCWGEWYCHVLGVPAVAQDNAESCKLCVGHKVLVVAQDGPHLTLNVAHNSSSKVFARLVAPCATSTLNSLIALHLDGQFEVHADIIEVEACSNPNPDPLKFGLGTHVKMACDDELNTGKVVALNPLRPEPYLVEYVDTDDLNRTNPEWLSFECPQHNDAGHNTVRGRWRQGTESPEVCELSHITQTVPQLCYAMLLRFSVHTELIPLATRLDVRFRTHFVTVFSNLQEPAPLLPPAQLAEYVRHTLDRDTAPKGLQRVYDRMRSCKQRTQPAATAANIEAAGAANAIAPKCRPAVCLVSLPTEMLQLACSWLHAASLDAFACSCLAMQKASRGVVPGLRLKLFSHQLEGLRWIRWREYARDALRPPQCRWHLLGAQGTKRGASSVPNSTDCPGVQAETVWRTILRARDCAHGHCANNRPAAAVDLLTLNVLPCQSRKISSAAARSCADDEGDEVSEVNDTLPRHLMHQRTRGGLLCDEPGLGKTVTVIAAVLATAGLMPQRETWTAADDRLQQQVLVKRAWASLDAIDRRRMLQQLLNELQRSTAHENVAPFLMPVDGRMVDMKLYHSIVSTPMDLGTVQSSISGGVDYAPPPVGRGIVGFVEDVRLTFENAIAFNESASHPIHVAAKILLDRFQCLMYGGQNALMPRLEAFAAQNPSDEDIAANRRKRRAMLLASAATLVVVPGPLLSHWREQLTRHVDWNAVRFIPPTPLSAPHVHVQEASNFEQCVLIDDPKGLLCSRGAPRAEDMASKLIVITTVERLSAEQRRMEREQEKFEQDMEREHGRSPTRRPSKRGGGQMPQQQSGRLAGENGLWAAERSPFQQVHWLRVVLDEGHVLGSCSLTSFNMLLDGIDAERTWAMTGTPTKDTSAGVALRNLFGLLRFLKHAPFGRTETRGIDAGGHLQPGGGRRAWNEIISEPYAAGCFAAEERLVQLLRGLMIRNTKADVPEIPKPVRRTVRLEMSDSEQESYNTRLAFIKTNIVLTQKPDGRVQDESLMHARNAADMARQMTFLRMLCVGGGAQLPSITEANRQEANEMMRSPSCSHPACIDKPRGSNHTQECPAWTCGLIGFNAAEEARLRMDRFIGRAITAKLTLCGQCGIALSLQLVTPCGHFICPECMASALRTRFTGRSSRARRVVAQDKIIWDGTCAECGYAYTFDELQLLQPGFMVDWQERLLEASVDRSWHAAAVQQVATVAANAALAVDDANTTNVTVLGPGTDSSLLENAVAAADGSSTSNYGPNSVSRAGAHHAVGNSMHHVQGGAKSEHIIRRIRIVRAQQRAHASSRASSFTSTVPNSKTLGSRVANSASPFRPGIRPKPLTLRHRDENAADDPPLQGCSPVKAIVFSQFRQALNVVGHDLIMQFGQDAVAEFFGAYRSVELDKFRTNMLTVWCCPRCGHENQTVERTCQRPMALLRFPVAHTEMLQPGQAAQALAGQQTPVAGATFEDVRVPAEFIEGHFLGRSYRRGQTVEMATHIPSMRQGLHRFAGQSGRVQDMSKCRRKRAKAPETHRRVDCFIMLLSNDGAVGLDLSFVTHIFLLDKIFNPALEKQVIARAHRMGATQPVVVEQLLARGTVEELRAGISDELHDDGSKAENEDEGLGALMASARLLRKHEYNDRNGAAAVSCVGKQPSEPRRAVTWAQ